MKIKLLTLFILATMYHNVCSALNLRLEFNGNNDVEVAASSVFERIGELGLGAIGTDKQEQSSSTKGFFAFYAASQAIVDGLQLRNEYDLALVKHSDENQNNFTERSVKIKAGVSIEDSFHSSGETGFGVALKASRFSDTSLAKASGLRKNLVYPYLSFTAKF